jgi:hypothetical protein
MNSSVWAIWAAQGSNEEKKIQYFFWAQNRLPLKF